MGKVARRIQSVPVTLDLGGSDVRVGRYGDTISSTSFYEALGLADEGSVWLGTNPTSESGISASVATAYSATASGFVSLQNRDSGSDSGVAKCIYPVYLKFRTVTAPASATRWLGVIDVDNVLSRYTSGGTAITPSNVNMNVSNTGSVATLNVGALTTVALSSGGRTFARPEFRPVIPVAGDTYIVSFGCPSGSVGNDALNGTNPVNAQYPCAPLVIGPGHTMVLSVFGASNAITGWAAEFEICWVER